MAQADSNHTTKLSGLCGDPMLRDAFLRAERDLGDDYDALVAVDHPRTLDGGAAERLTNSTGIRSLASVEV